ncbi:hypothetical protein Shel_01290 [Slackia heliotrinireducens DSM 20476]|uniref:Uncharacterized protein n=1 Tax=Slackia heliotrinireducens (strain ATCC 29202 / DSM 20476 / NCTC 11029 / RHS 1) TaxID=471855 RepID=C7N0X5_SLAHD|nr:hypothetical protein Shel_01290 [Slackia heliotrinireducens DSM 20476]
MRLCFTSNRLVFRFSQQIGAQLLGDEVYFFIGALFWRQLRYLLM